MPPTIIQWSDVPFEIFTIDDLYSRHTLETWLTCIKSTSQSETRPFTNSDFINGKIIHPEWSNIMGSTIIPLLPNLYTDRTNTQWAYISAAKYVMFAHIQTGQMFGIHTDTGCEFDDASQLYSKYTVLTYLNDDFDGGETIFYDDLFEEKVTIKPKKGRTLLFDIEKFHKGNVVLSGEKYWIGTELVCKRI
jgi:hypothetical protein